MQKKTKQNCHIKTIVIEILYFSFKDNKRQFIYTGVGGGIFPIEEREKKLT